jgi:hypothetical protein
VPSPRRNNEAVTKKRRHVIDIPSLIDRHSKGRSISVLSLNFLISVYSVRSAFVIGLSPRVPRHNCALRFTFGFYPSAGQCTKVEDIDPEARSVSFDGRPICSRAVECQWIVHQLKHVAVNHGIYCLIIPYMNNFVPRRPPLLIFSLITFV